MPNARYQEARLEVADLEGTKVIRLTGVYRLRVSHSADVEFRPCLTLRPDTSRVDVDVELRNLRANSFGFSYLCHVNWSYPDGGRLAQPVPLDPHHFEVATHPDQDAATTQYTAEIIEHPELGDLLDPNRPVLPEYCAVLKPVPDQDGWAHFLMVRPDGQAASVSYETAELPYAIRWISNTGDEQAAGFCLPATAHHRGRSAAEADGLLRTLPGHASVMMRIRIDLLGAAAAADRLAVIAAALHRSAA